MCRQSCSDRYSSLNRKGTGFLEQEATNDRIIVLIHACSQICFTYPMMDDPAGVDSSVCAYYPRITCFAS